MNLKNKWKETNGIGKISFSILVFSIFMVIVYGIFLGWKPSSDAGDWGNFGSYFASITGLLAFSGVLYTASLSEKRADKVKEESIKREERDLFFKLLELHQGKLSSIIYIEQDTKKVHSGLDAFEKYANILNNSLCDYSINYFIAKSTNSLQGMLMNRYMGSYMENDVVYDIDYDIKYDDNKYLKYIKDRCESIYNKNKTEDDSLFNVRSFDFERIQDIINENIQNTSFYKFFHLNEYKINSMKEIFENLNKPENTDGMYLGIKLVGNIINEQFGHILGQYFRNMYYVLDTCNNFKYDKGYYFKLFRAQLSRTEIVLCLLNSVSDKSSPKFVKLLNNEKYPILDDLYYKDLLLIQNDKYKGKELQFVKDMLNLYLEEQKESN